MNSDNRVSSDIDGARWRCLDSNNLFDSVLGEVLKVKSRDVPGEVSKSGDVSSEVSKCGNVSGQVAEGGDVSCQVTEGGNVSC